MSSSYGENIRMTIFGQSHSPAIGMTLEGIPAGSQIDMETLGAFLSRRAPGKNAFSTARKEADLPEFVSGIFNDATCGTPITALIRNTNQHSKDYDQLKNIPRPGHADLQAEIKYKGFQDHTGGGHFSGRLTAPLCIAGGICLQLLKEQGIEVFARIRSIGNIDDDSDFTGPVSEKEFPVVCDEIGEKMKELIAEARAEGDSVGGIVECVITGVPAGLGDPMFDGMENRIASIVFGIPAVKGLEFGAGFDVARRCGSENNDGYRMKEDVVMFGEDKRNGLTLIETTSNNAGGINGGITTGMPIVFRAAFKPTPSIAAGQQSVDLRTMKNTELYIEGRHDPCVVPRAVPVVEAAAAIAVYDAFLGRKREL